MIQLNLNFTSVSDLNNFHDYTDRVFLEHQKSIMNGDIGLAFTQLSHLLTMLKQHVRDEEQLLIPHYKQLIQPQPAGGAVRYYTGEHRMIIRDLNRIAAVLKEWMQNSPGDLHIVQQFDTCYKFKELLDHHDARERVFLYRLLDQKLDTAEKKDILEKIRQNMAAAYGQ